MKTLVIYDEKSPLAIETAKMFVKQEKKGNKVYPLQMGRDLKKGKKACSFLCFEEFCLCTIKEMGAEINDYKYIVVLDEENTLIANLCDEAGTFIHWNVRPYFSSSIEKVEKKIEKKVSTFMRLSERVVA